MGAGEKGGSGHHSGKISVLKLLLSRELLDVPASVSPSETPTLGGLCMLA